MKLMEILGAGKQCETRVYSHDGHVVVLTLMCNGVVVWSVSRHWTLVGQGNARSWDAALFDAHIAANENDEQDKAALRKAITGK